MFSKNRYVSRVWIPAYEGNDDAAAAAKAAAEAAAAEAAKKAAAGKTLTQDEINKMLAEDRRKHQANQEKLIAEVEALRAKSSLTEKERTELNERLEVLRNENLTKDEQARREIEKIRKQLDETSTNMKKEVQNWQNRFTESTITRDITDSAAAESAYSPSQLVAILRPNTRLVEVLDAAGNPTGEFTPKVKFRDKDKAGKPVELELTVPETVKRMKELPDFANLFKGSGTGGFGGSGSGGGSKIDVAELAKDAAAYREARKKGQV